MLDEFTVQELQEKLEFVEKTTPMEHILRYKEYDAITEKYGDLREEKYRESL